MATGKIELSVGYTGSFDEELNKRVDNIEDEIDEINSSLDNIEQQLQGGLNIDLSDYQVKTDNSLVTSNKTIIGAINEVFQCVSNAKKNLAEAITDKGVETSATDTFQTMANNINKINTNDNSSSKGFEYINDMSGEEI